MGKIELDHTGSGSGVTLSSDGTDLLLDGTAIGGGGGDLITSASFPSASFTLTNSDKGKYYHMTGSNQTITLPSSSAISAGWYVFVSLDKSAVYRLNINAASGDSWYNGETSSYSIYAGNTVLVIYRGSGEWGLIGNDYYMATSAYGSSSRPTANGGRAVAIGAAAVAAGNYTYAFGKDAYATGLYATAMTRSRAGAGSAFAAAIDTNTSSYGATGTNSVAIGNLAKTVGINTLAIGARAQTTGASAIAIGHSYGNYGCVAASGGIAIGDGNNADAIFSTALGYRAKAATKGKFAFAVGQFAAQGDAQGGMYILRADTTDATATVLTTNNSTAAADNQIVAASDTCIMFSGTLVAMQNGAQDQGGWEIKGLLKNDGGTTTLVSSNIQTFAGGNGWTVALTADNTNNALAITCTGEAAHNIRWVANISTSEVTYAQG